MILHEIKVKEPLNMGYRALKEKLVLETTTKRCLQKKHLCWKNSVEAGQHM